MTDSYAGKLRGGLTVHACSAVIDVIALLRFTDSLDRESGPDNRVGVMFHHRSNLSALNRELPRARKSLSASLTERSASRR